jgi:hypothetical protein
MGMELISKFCGKLLQSPNAWDRSDALCALERIRAEDLSVVLDLVHRWLREEKFLEEPRCRRLAFLQNSSELGQFRSLIFKVWKLSREVFCDLLQLVDNRPLAEVTFTPPWIRG